MDFKREFLIDGLCLPDSAIEDNLYDSSRWTEEREIIFKFDGKHYRTYYSVGATEMQYVDPWEDEEIVRCQEVELKEVVVKNWVAVRKEGEHHGL